VVLAQGVCPFVIAFGCGSPSGVANLVHGSFGGGLGLQLGSLGALDSLASFFGSWTSSYGAALSSAVGSASSSAWAFSCVTALLGWLALLYNRSMGYGASVDICVVVLCAACMGFLVAQDVVTLLLCFELVNLPLVGLLLLRPAVLLSGGSAGGIKGWVSAVGLLVGYGVVSGVALVAGLLLLAGHGVAVVDLGAMDDGASSLAIGVLLVALGAGVKLSVVPLHVWLGKVHAEASTVGSVLLAGVGLKLGYVGLVWCMGLGGGSVSLSSFVVPVLLLSAGLVLSLSLLAAVDAKRWVAMYSVVHMGALVVLGVIGVPVSALLVGMWGHSVVSGLMFLVVGLLCEVSGVRLVVLLRGLASSLGVSGLLLVLCLANAAFPCTVLFWVELLAGFAMSGFPGC